MNESPLPMAEIQVPPLRARTVVGKPYERSAAVLDEIRRILALPRSVWRAQAKNLQNETLVFLIRQTHLIDDEVCGALLERLRRRITSVVHRVARTADPIEAEEILLQVDLEILGLVLSKEPSRKTEFLEVAFAKAAETLTIDVIRKQNSSLMVDGIPIVEISMDSDGEMGRAIELVPENQPTPLESVIQSERERLLEVACAAVKDPRHLEAVMMHHVAGIPIRSSIRGRKTVSRHFRKSPREIQYWIETALKQMRVALGIPPIAQSRRRRGRRNSLRAAIGRHTAARRVSKNGAQAAFRKTFQGSSSFFPAADSTSP